MAWTAEARFDNLNTGDLNGQAGGTGLSGNWTGSVNYDVSTAQKFAGAQSVVNASGSGIYCNLASTLTGDGNVVYVAMRTSTTSSGQAYFMVTTAADIYRARIIFNASGNVTLNGNTVFAYAANTWYVLRLTINVDASTCSMAYSTAAYGAAPSWSAESSSYALNSTGNITKVYLEQDVTRTTYWDHISPTSPYLETAITSISGDAGITTSMISYWSLEEASGTRVDAHAANDLTDNNTVTNAAGKQGNAAVFVDANAEYLSITDASQSGLDITGNFSFSCWVKPTDTGLSLILNKYNSTGNQRGYQIYINSGTTFTTVLSVAGTSGVTGSVTSTFSAGTWYHLVFTYTTTGTIGRFYVNSVPTGKDTVFTGISGIYNNNADFLLGTNEFKSTGNSSDMTLDETAIWSRTLTPDEVIKLYNLGTPPPYTASGGATFTPKVIFY